ncbi:hypothetical protein ACIQ7D_06450 [Streptomyces sp. NPDC096310]|uniref:hypothetical protein n=1 Tax=Streptomyces sp. NPDC096310 TaxID=3366082 RepID=UPI0037F99303
MTLVALTTDHPAWTTAPDGTQTRLMDTGSGLWLATFTPQDGFGLDNLAGSEDTKPTTSGTRADELPAHLPSLLGAPLAALGTVLRVPNPSLWDAVSTAILRQVVRAAQARKVYRAWCQTHGTTLNTIHGPLSVVPGPEAVLTLAEKDFKNVGAAFHRTALQAAAAAYLDQGERWRTLTADQLVIALDDVPRIGPWTASAAASDYSGDFSVYPHHDLAVRTWARRIAPDHPWPTTEKEFGTTWRRWADDTRQLHALTLFTLTWGTTHADDRQHGGTAPQD